MKNNGVAVSGPGGDRATRRERSRLYHEGISPPHAVATDDFRGSSRYELLIKIGTGGSASVYIGRVTGSAGFSRLVAVKRSHPHLAHDPSVERMMHMEARLASGLNHANVVAVQDVERIDQEILLILDYVEGASLAELLDAGATTGRELPSRVAIRIALDACAGLTAVHEIEGRDGRPVGFLHRDVSPQNILVGVDGTARITDFGLAKHQNAGMSKATGSLKGKLAYLAPEVIDEGVFSIQSDIFAMGVVIWEALATRRLFRGDSWADTVRKVGLEAAPPISSIVPALGERMDSVVAKALEKVASRRYSTVRELQEALEGIAGRSNLIATSSEVSSYVRSVVGDALQRRRELIRSFDGGVSDDMLSTATLSMPHPHGRAAAQAAQAAYVPDARGPMSPGAAAALPYVGPPMGGYAWSTPLDTTPTQARATDPRAPLVHAIPAAPIAAPAMPRQAPAPPARGPMAAPYPAAGLAAAPSRPVRAWPPEPATPQSFAIEIAPDEIELELEEESTVDNTTTAPAPVRRPAPEAPPVAMTSFLQRNLPRIEVRELPRIYYPDDDDTGQDTDVVETSSPSNWDRDPLAPWVPPTPPPPPPERELRQGTARGRKVAGLVTFGAAAGAALLMALVPSLLASAPGAGSAAPESAAAAAAQPGAPERAMAAAPERAPAKAPERALAAAPKAAGKDGAKAEQPAVAAPKKEPAALTPDALPDAVEALTPDALPDATAPRRSSAAAPRAAARPAPPSAAAAQKPSGGKRPPPNPYRR